MKHRRTILAQAVWAMALVVGAAQPARADVKDGVDAWARGDYDGAVAQWQGPSAKGDPDAMFNMGQAYKLGRGVPKDVNKAEELYARAAQKGHIRAADNYGMLLFQTNRQAEAMPWLIAAADRGEPRAMYVLGIAAYNGDYTQKDLVRAYALMTRAAQAGLQQAINSLAAMNEAIPIEQRQQGVAMAEDLDRKAVAARASEMGSADLDAQRPVVPLSPGGSAPIQRTGLPPAQIAVATPVPDQPPVAPPPVKRQPVRAAMPGRAAMPVPVRVAPVRPAPVAVASTATGGSWRVQLGAFGQKSNADAMWAKAHTRPEIAGHPRIDAGTGVTRLLAGGYSETEAQHACAGLKAAGLTCLVTSH